MGWKNGSLTSYAHEWSFGDVAAGNIHHGVKIPIAGKIIRGTIQAVAGSNAAGEIRVGIVIDSNLHPYGAMTKKSGDWGTTTIFLILFHLVLIL